MVPAPPLSSEELSSCREMATTKGFIVAFSAILTERPPSASVRIVDGQGLVLTYHPMSFSAMFQGLC